MSSLKRSAARGAVWTVTSGISQALIRLSASMVLARMLAPEDFGLFGMALLVVELAMQLGMLAMTQGLIAKNDITDDDLSTCFWSIAGINLLLFAIVFSCAPLFARLMNEARIEEVLRFVSSIFIISTFSTVGYAILAKRIEFGKTSLIQSTGVLFESALAVYLATTTDLKYWSLVYAMLISSVYVHVSVFLVSRWIPKFIFNKESFRYQVRFGVNGLGSNIAGYLSQNIDYWLVGRLLGANSLGLYEYAYRIPHMLQYKLAMPVGAVVFPTLAKLQDDDRALINGCMKATQYITLVAFPMLGGLAVLADPFVNLLWGEQWKSIVVPLQILCLCTAIRLSTQSLGSVFLCKHRPDIPFKQSLITCLSVVVFVPLGLYSAGIVGVALAMLLSTFSNIYYVYHAFKLTKMPARMLLVVLYPPAISTVTSSLLAYFVFAYSLFEVQIIVFVCSILAGIIGYVASYYFLFKKDFIEIIKTSAGILRPAKHVG